MFPLHHNKMRQITSIVLVLAFSSFSTSHTGVDGVKLPEVFTTDGSSVYIPCNVDTGTKEEYTTPISWTRVGSDGFVETMIAPNEPDFVPQGNVKLFPSRSSNFPLLEVSNMAQSLSGLYTCHTDKGDDSTVVHVVNEFSPVTSSLESRNSRKQSCSEGFDLVQGRCIYFHSQKMNWRNAYYECANKTSSLITFQDVKDLMSFLLTLQNSGLSHIEFPLWVGYATFDESNSSFAPLRNNFQVSPKLNQGHATVTHCGYLNTINFAGIVGVGSQQCVSLKYHILCEQPTL